MDGAWAVQDERLAVTINTRFGNNIFAAFLDDGWNSGDTWRQSIAQLAALGVKHIFSYILICRAEPLQGRFLAGLASIRVTSLQQVPHKEEVCSLSTETFTYLRIPTYLPGACPICHQALRYAECVADLHKAGIEFMVDFETHETNRLQLFDLRRLRDARQPRVRQGTRVGCSLAGFASMRATDYNDRRRMAKLTEVRITLAGLEGPFTTQHERNEITTLLGNEEAKRMALLIFRDEPELWMRLDNQCSTASQTVSEYCLTTLKALCEGSSLSSIGIDEREALAFVHNAFRLFSLDSAEDVVERTGVLRIGAPLFQGCRDKILLIEGLLYYAWVAWRKKHMNWLRQLVPSVLSILEAPPRDESLEGKRARAVVSQLSLWVSLEQTTVASDGLSAAVLRLKRFYEPVLGVGHSKFAKAWSLLKDYDDTVEGSRWANLY